MKGDGTVSTNTDQSQNTGSSEARKGLSSDVAVTGMEKREGCAFVR